MILNFELFTEKQVYTFYPFFKSKEKEIESKSNLTADDEMELAKVKELLEQIEEYTRARRQEGIRWSLTSLFQDSGMNPTLILEFYPGSDSYNLYGKNLVVNVEYNEADLLHIFESIRDQAQRVTGQLKFKSVPNFEDGELNTGDIFAIQ